MIVMLQRVKSKLEKWIILALFSFLFLEYRFSQMLYPCIPAWISNVVVWCYTTECLLLIHTSHCMHIMEIELLDKVK